MDICNEHDKIYNQYKTANCSKCCEEKIMNAKESFKIAGMIAYKLEVMCESSKKMNTKCIR